jgi:hypothetical protein
MMTTEFEDWKDRSRKRLQGAFDKITSAADRALMAPDAPRGPFCVSKPGTRCRRPLARCGGSSLSLRRMCALASMGPAQTQHEAPRQKMKGLGGWRTEAQ